MCALFRNSCANLMHAFVLPPSHGRFFHWPDGVKRASGSAAIVPLPVHFAEPMPPLNMESFLETPNNITSLSCAGVGAGSCGETVIEVTMINHTQQTFMEFALRFIASIGAGRSSGLITSGHYSLQVSDRRPFGFAQGRLWGNYD